MGWWCPPTQGIGRLLQGTNLRLELRDLGGSSHDGGGDLVINSGDVLVIHGVGDLVVDGGRICHVVALLWGLGAVGRWRRFGDMAPDGQHAVVGASIAFRVRTCCGATTHGQRRKYPTAGAFTWTKSQAHRERS